MQIDSNTIVSMTDANQNFSKVTRIVDQYGRAVIFKNNSPRYLIVDFSIADENRTAPDSEIMAMADEIMDQYDDAFRELAK